MFTTAAAAFTFGLLSAYISIQIFNSIHVDSEKPNQHCYDSFIFTLNPEGWLNEELHGPAEELCENEDHFDDQDVVPIMLMNGLGWMAIILVFSFPIVSLRTSWRRSHDI